MTLFALTPNRSASRGPGIIGAVRASGRGYMDRSTYANPLLVAYEPWRPGGMAAHVLTRSTAPGRNASQPVSAQPSYIRHGLAGSRAARRRPVQKPCARSDDVKAFDDLWADKYISNDNQDGSTPSLK